MKNIFINLNYKGLKWAFSKLNKIRNVQERSLILFLHDGALMHVFTESVKETQGLCQSSVDLF